VHVFISKLVNSLSFKNQSTALHVVVKLRIHKYKIIKLDMLITQNFGLPALLQKTIWAVFKIQDDLLFHNHFRPI
jgi:hypothetical protein